jgi:hypothetical protein
MYVLLLRENYLNLNLIPYRSNETWFYIFLDIAELISTSNMKLIDIIKQVYNTNNIPLILNSFTKDFYQYSLYLVADTICISDINDRYEPDYDKDRMFFRIELYKCGWDPVTIEKYIHKYILKLPYHNTEEKIINEMYHNLKEQLKITIKQKDKSVGRPKLPESIKNYVKQKHLQKTKVNMNITYQHSKKYKFIKDNLLTLNDITYLESVVTDKTLLEKLKKLQVS